MLKVKRFFTVGDVIVIALLAALTILMVLPDDGEAEGPPVVEVAVGGDVVFRGPLAEDFVYEAIGPLGKTQVVGKNGKVRVAQSCCPLELCVEMGEIERPGQILVCVPNEVTVRITGRGYIDAISM